jgi:hypothetical protein
MRVFAAVAVALLALTILGPVASPSPLASTPGDVVRIISGTRTIEKSQLTAPEAPGIRPGPHTILFSVDEGAVSRLQNVILSYSVNGQAAKDIQMQRSVDHAGFYEASLPSQVALANGESTITFTVGIEPSSQARQGPYTYVIDSLAPRLASMHINGNPTSTVAEGSDVSWSINTTDAGSLSALVFTVQNAGATQTVNLPLGGHEHAAASPVALPRGIYDVRVDATDSAGNSASQGFTQAVVVATGGLRMLDGGIHLVAGATQSDALPGGSVTEPVLDGFQNIAVSLLTEKPFQGENAVERLHYSITGAATQSSPHITLASSDAGAALEWTGTLPKSLWPATPAGKDLSFLLESYGNRVPSRLTGPWIVHVDASLPTVSQHSINGGQAKTIRQDTPISLQVNAVDGDGAIAVVAEVLFDLTTVATKAMTGNGNTYRADFLDGLSLGDGTYDVRYTATDGAGHLGILLAKNAITIDNAAPLPTSILVNGAPRLESRSNQPLTIAVGLADATATSAAVDVLHANGALAKNIQLTHAGAGTWTANLPDGVSLPDGAYRFRVNVLDGAGNTANMEWPVSPLVIDNLAPQMQSSTITYALGKTAAKHGDDVHIAVTLTEANTLARVTAYVGTTAVDLDRSTSGNVMTGILTAPWGNGTFNLGLDARDAAGNTRLVNVPILLDNTPPTLQLVEPRYVGGEDSAVLGESVGVAIRAIDPLSTITAVLVDASPANPASGSIQAIRQGVSSDYLASFPSIQTGEYDLQVLAVDGAGNIREGSVTVIIDRAGPTISNLLVDGVATLILGAPRHVSATATVLSARGVTDVEATLLDAAGAAVRTVDMNSSAGQWKASIPMPAEEGAYSVVVSAKDVDGRSDLLAPDHPNIVLDKSAPAIPSFKAYPLAESTANPPEGFFGDPVTFVLKFIDATDVQGTLKATTPSGSTLESTMVRSGSELRSTMTILETGRITVSASIFDAAGHTNSATAVVVQLASGTEVPGVPNGIQVAKLPNGKLHFGWDLPADGIDILGYSYGVDGTPPPRVGVTGNFVEITAPSPGNHSFFLQAIGKSGQIGPLSKFDFRVDPSTSTLPGTPTTPTTPVANQTVPTTAGIYLERFKANLTQGRTVPVVLSWLVAGENADLVDCVEVQGAVGSGAFTPIGCRTGYSANLYDGLPVEPGDVIHLRARWHAANSLGPWALANATVPLERQWPTVRATSGPEPLLSTNGNANGLTILVLDEDGDVVASRIFDSEGGAWTTQLDGLAPGTYKTRLESPDGQQANGPEVVVATTAVQPKLDGNTWMVIAIGFGVMVAVGAVVVLLVLRRGAKASPPAAAEPGPGLGPSLVDEAVPVAARKPGARVKRNGVSVLPEAPAKATTARKVVPASQAAKGKVAPLKVAKAIKAPDKPAPKPAVHAKAPAGNARQAAGAPRTGAYGTKQIPAR